LLPLGPQAIGEKGEVGAIRTALVGGLLDGFELVFKDGFAVLQQASNQRALAVVYAACRNKPKESLCHDFLLLYSL